jgi:3,4-dihydroxy 2-butanone 4-phosphate synthase / GTP cyclohydrolase II
MTAVLHGNADHNVDGQWGPRSTTSEVERALAALRAGQTVVLQDDTGHGHGYLVHAAESSNADLVAFMVRYSSGYLRVAIADDDAARMNLPLMVPAGADPNVEPFTVTVDSSHLNGTGISATDRAHTIRLLASPETVPADFTRPGHILPVRVPTDDNAPWAPYRAILELIRRAGLNPAAAYAEIVADGDGLDLAHGVEVSIIASRLGLPVVRISRLTAK